MVEPQPTACVVCHKPSTQQTCPRCASRVRTNLHTIATSYVQLEVELVASTSATDDSGRPTGPRTLPCSLDILNLLQAGGIVTILESWEDDFRSHRGFTAPTPTRNRMGTHTRLTTTTHFLIANTDWAAQDHPAFGSFADEIRDLRTNIDHALGTAAERTRRPLGRFRCPIDTNGQTCDGRLYIDLLDPANPYIYCRTCQAQWEPAGWHLLGAALAKPITTKEAATIFGVHERTIRKWIDMGRLTNHGTDRAARVSLAELQPDRILA